jgi:DNA-binding transcriptional MocR family regulator
VAPEQIIAGATARDIAASIEVAVTTGELQPSARLPSVRLLAAQLGVSPATVSTAYRTLRLRGVVTAEPGSGTRIGRRPPLATERQLPPSAGMRDVASGNPDQALLPSLVHVINHVDSSPVLYGDRTITKDLHEAGTRMFADLHLESVQVGATGGAMDAIERLLVAHLSPGDRVIVEDPGYANVFDLIRALGLETVPVPIDENGMLPHALHSALKGSAAAACVVTPRAQNPFGSAVTEDRAAELRETLASAPNLLLIENDHASLVAGADYVTLTANRKRWAVARSLSKVLSPDLRIALLAADQFTLSRVEGRQRLGTGWVSHILQRIAADALSDTDVQSSIATAGRTYRERREAMLNALATVGVDAHGRSGFNVVVPVAEEAAVLRHMHDAGWILGAGEPHRLASPPFVRITVADVIPDESHRIARDLANALGPTRRSHLA